MLLALSSSGPRLALASLLLLSMPVGCRQEPAPAAEATAAPAADAPNSDPSAWIVQAQALLDAD